MTRTAERGERLGRFSLLVVFLCLLGGRFSLSRLHSSLPAFDLRFAGLAVAVLGFLLWRATDEREVTPVRSGPGAILFAGWLWFMAASALWAPPDARVGENLLDLAFMGAFVGLAWACVGWLPSDTVDRLWKWLAITGVVYFVAAIAAGPDVQGRYAALGGGPNVFVRVMVLAALAVTYLASHKGRTRLLWLLPLFVLGAVLSGSRGGMVAFAVVVVMGGWPMLRRMRRKVVVRLLVLAASAAAVVPRILGPETLDSLRTRWVVLTFESGYSSGRDSIYSQVWELFSQSPIFGVGLDGYYGLVGKHAGFEYPHNVVLASAAEGGIIGAGLFLLAVLLFWLATRPGPMPPSALYLTLAAVYLLGASMFSGDYYDARLLWFFFGLAAIEASRVQRGLTERLPSSSTVTRQRAPLGDRSTTPRVLL